ncbi:DedA family protein [Anaeromyxobacter paludicola]|uniref:DedA family protein n=1 Tax=Anaeromyxobacter paludicola TaxID=2918171 RepID=A0ABM7XCZ7_9BACT|nr:DedA family protein [Anaeromyxobacter paludicola]BDG09741.1 DedA family protein [Anaeromyxobacter paludicola]
MLLRLLTHFSYAAIFGVLVSAGVGIPFPEELTQLTAGYLAHEGVISFLPALAATYLGILTGDYLLFRLGRKHGRQVLENPRIARVFTPKRRAWIECHFEKHDFLTIMAARHASGFRLPTFALAGASGVSSRTFLLADGLSALLSVPLVVGLGYFFATQIEVVKRRVHEVELGVAVAFVLAIAGWAFLHWRRGRADSPRFLRPGPGRPVSSADSAAPAPRRSGP